eukprot:5590761-Pyramimonas_sp.AAC.1
MERPLENSPLEHLLEVMRRALGPGTRRKMDSCFQEKGGRHTREGERRASSSVHLLQLRPGTLRPGTPRRSSLHSVPTKVRSTRWTRSCSSGRVRHGAFSVSSTSTSCKAWNLLATS